MSMRMIDGKIIVYNPSTNDEVGSLDISSKESVDYCIKKSKDYNNWTSLSLSKRCKLIKKFRKIFVKNSDLIQKILKDETGKKDFDVFIEFFTVLEHLREIPKLAKKALKPERRNSGLMKNKKSYVFYEPMGIARVISPWNYPLATPIITSIEALVAGNNVILKPSEHTPLTSSCIKRIWDENIGYPSAFQIINGGADVGAMLVSSKDTDIICFTGSTAVGLAAKTRFGAGGRVETGSYYSFFAIIRSLSDIIRCRRVINIININIILLFSILLFW